MSEQGERAPLLDLPPTYASATGANSEIACNVCGSRIDISTKREQHVVKCDNCNEATPIKMAPPGKKYIRCPCNCLLICKSGALKIACPRENCKRIINLSENNSRAGATNTNGSSNDNARGTGINGGISTPGMCRVTCGHCFDSFLFNSLSNQLARCPFCRKLSSVGAEFARTRGTVFLIFFLMLLAASIGTTFGTYNYLHEYKGLIALYVCLYFTSLFFLYRSVYYLSMKISTIETSGA